MTDYNAMELMIAAASRELEDGASVAVGTGAPCAAAMLAQKIYAPSLLILFEAGGVDPKLQRCRYRWVIHVHFTKRAWQAVWPTS